MGKQNTSKLFGFLAILTYILLSFGCLNVIFQHVQVKEVLPSFSEYLRGTALQQRDGKVADMQIHYHVEGDINAAYSEILLGRLCGGD